MGNLFGGGSAAADAQKSRDQARVSNDRMLSQQAGQASTRSTARRAPRGRKLFTTEASQKDTVG
jgi:hypothetical protein